MMIYVDMDGVSADFFGGLAKLSGYPHWKDIPNTEDTVARLKGTSFFNTLEPFPTAKTLLSVVHWMSEGEWSILSTPLQGDEENSAYWKNKWLDNLLAHKDMKGVMPMSRIYAHSKQLYATNGIGEPNLLIDDRPHNVRLFEEFGGIGIRYQANESSLPKLIRKLYMIIKKGDTP